MLLDAAAALHRLDLLTVVAGDGPLRAGLQRRIDDEGLPVRLLGRRDDVPDLLAAADVVVSTAPSGRGSPLGLQEALHAGAAVVATDAGRHGGRHRGRRRSWSPPVTPPPCPQPVRDVVPHGGIRDNLRSTAGSGPGTCPREPTPLEAALRAYASVGAAG